MTIADLKIGFTVSQNQLKLFLEGINPQQASAIPEKGGNPVNWILGHILSERAEALGRINSNFIEDIPDLSMYVTGTDVNTDNLLPYEELLALIPLTFDRLLEAIDTLEQSTIDNILPGTMLGQPRSFGQDLNTYVLHEMYHIGQISTLKRYL